MEHRTSLGIFMALAANRPMTALSFLSSPSARIVRSASGVVTKIAAASTPSEPVSAAGDADLVDVDANLLHPDLASDIEHHIQVVHQRTQNWTLRTFFFATDSSCCSRS